AEELIEPASAVDHSRLAALYVMVAQCWQAGRLEEAVRYSDAGQLVVSDRSNEVPYGVQGWLGSAYLAIGQPERTVEWGRAELARGRDTHSLTRAALVQALMIAGSPDEAMAEATGLLDAAEATHNPYAFAFAHLAYGFAFREADPDRARDVLRRGLVIAEDSGNRLNETYLAQVLAQLEAVNGGPLAALDYTALAIRNHHDSGNTIQVRACLAVLARLFDHLRRYEAAATIAGFAFNPITAAWYGEITTVIAHLRDVHGDQTYEALAHIGEAMTTTEIAAYAYDQIDQARAELDAVSK
ncbi:MAG TPA: adenylate/guanylate cyclase domain-containing protein, partial [Mycobacterium sp.]|nr:adenylate/guanylate cyclase domain-containing protein [Mycobacterium sp.]